MSGGGKATPDGGPVSESVSSTPEPRMDEHFREKHASFLKRIAEGPVGLLLLGDSITRRWEENPDLWRRYFDRYQAANFGVGGDATRNLLWRIENGELDGIRPRVSVLLIGTNDVPTATAAEITAAIARITNTIRGKLPETRIILMALLPRGPQRPEGATADNPYYMDVIRAVNRELSKLDDGAKVRFLDIGPRFIGSDGEIVPSFMPDRLHLVGPGFEVWGDAMESMLAALM